MTKKKRSNKATHADMVNVGARAARAVDSDSVAFAVSVSVVDAVLPVMKESLAAMFDDDAVKSGVRCRLAGPLTPEGVKHARDQYKSEEVARRIREWTP